MLKLNWRKFSDSLPPSDISAWYHITEMYAGKRIVEEYFYDIVRQNWFNSELFEVPPSEIEKKWIAWASKEEVEPFQG